MIIKIVLTREEVEILYKNCFQNLHNSVTMEINTADTLLKEPATEIKTTTTENILPFSKRPEEY